MFPYFIYFSIKDATIFKFGGRLTIFLMCPFLFYMCFHAMFFNLCSFLLLVYVSLF